MNEQQLRSGDLVEVCGDRLEELPPAAQLLAKAAIGLRARLLAPDPNPGGCGSAWFVQTMDEGMLAVADFGRITIAYPTPAGSIGSIPTLLLRRIRPDDGVKEALAAIAKAKGGT